MSTQTGSMSVGEPTIQLLREVRLLSIFDEQEMNQLIEMGQKQNFEAHSNIVIEGEMTWGVYLILSGTVGIFKTNKLSGNIYDIGELREGSFFGEMSLIDNDARSATVKAVTDVQAFYIAKEQFMNFINSSQEIKNKFYDSCIRVLVSRLRELDDNYVVSQYQLWKTALMKDGKVA